MKCPMRGSQCRYVAAALAFVTFMLLMLVLGMSAMPTRDKEWYDGFCAGYSSAWGRSDQKAIIRDGAWTCVPIQALK